MNEAHNFHPNPDTLQPHDMAAYGELGEDLAFTEDLAGSPDSADRQRDQIGRMHERARTDVAYYGSAAYAAFEQDNPNEALRMTLEVRLPNQLERPYETNVPPLSAENHAEFDGFLTEFTDAARRRFRLQEEDAKPGAPYTDRAARYWGYNITSNKDGEDVVERVPGMADELSAKMAGLLDKNPGFRTLIEENLATRTGHLTANRERVGMAVAELERKKGMYGATLKDLMNPENNTKEAEINDRVKKYNEKLADPRGGRWAEKTAAHYGGQPGDYDNWRNRVPHGNIPYLSAPLRAIAEMNPSDRRKKQLHTSHALFERGEGVRAPYGEQNPNKYGRTDPERGSHQWYGNRGLAETRALLQVYETEGELIVLNEQEVRATAAIDSLGKILDAAENQRSGAIFAKEHGNPVSLMEGMEETVYISHVSLFAQGRLSIEDDHRIFTIFNEAADYINQLDTAIANATRASQWGSRQQLVDMRNETNAWTNRYRFDAEKLRIQMREKYGFDNPEHDPGLDTGYFGQYGSKFQEDDGIVIEPHHAVLYEDGSIDYPHLRTRGRRYPDGSLRTT